MRTSKKEPRLKKETPTKDKPILKPGDPFTILNNFWNSEIFNRYSNYERNKGYFMINRRLAIMYPIMAAYFSKVGINGGEVIRWWKNFIVYQHPTYPRWLYTKSVAKSKATKEYNPSQEVLSMYCKLNDCTMKEVKEAIRLFPDEIVEEFKEIEKLSKDI